jgi:iron(III) transport system ATP-binding protein
VPEINVSALGLDYAGKTAINGVTFTAREGEFLTLLGPSGCGKTTTLMSIAGLTKPSRGSITCGSDVFFDSQRSIDQPPERRNCGVVFQSYAIWPHMSVADNVAYPLRLRKTRKAEIAARVHEALSMVDLAALADRYPHQLSGGQQQRVALARAITYNPGVLLLDEPLSNLDAKLREQARSWLKEFQSSVGLTTIFVTHDQDEALAMSDRTIVMNDGHIEQIGTPEDIYHRPSSPFVASFLGSANLLSGTLADSVSGLAQVRIHGSERPVTVRDDIGRATGEVQVMIRPEDLALLPEATDPDLAPLRGVVTSRMFLGASFRYEVDCGAQNISVSARERWPAGPVRLAFRPEQARLFPREATDSRSEQMQETAHA